jgi:hypothetical protein
MTFFYVSSHFAFFCTLMISKYFFYSDFANAQAELGGSFQWCIDNGMQLNLEKCKSMRFTRSRFTRHFQYELSGHRLDSVDSICDFGVVLSTQSLISLHTLMLMLSYIRRVGKEFRDPYFLKKL